MNFLKRAGLSLWARKGRTLVMLATFLVMSAMVLGGVLIDDATARAGEQAKRKIGADVTLDMDMDALTGGGGGLQAPQISADIVDKIGASPLVESYNYDSFNGVELTGGSKIVGKSMDPSRPNFTLAMGVLDSRLMPDFASGKWKLLAGKPLTAADKDRDAVLVEERLAKKNNLEPDDKIRLGPNDPGSKGTAEFTLRGIYRDPSDKPDPEYMQFPADRLIMPSHALSRLNGEQGGSTRLGGATFKLKDPATFGAFRSWARKQAGSALDGFELGINDKALQQMTGPMSSVSSSATVAMWLIGVAGAAVLALLVTLAVKQRHKEYGVLLAMGEKKGKVIAQQAVEIVAVAALAIGLSCLIAEPLTQSAGNALVSGEAAAERKKINSWTPPPPGRTGVDQGRDPNDQPVEGADPIDEITVRLDTGALSTIAGTGLGIALLATAIPAASVLRLNPKTILTKGK
ncbi:ABC transporter permease [Streptomyces sp. DASNCL29]|uniref:ABC transporter permease n=1 Tax=Streptomyces sp. DASNCL29 TaxID=2583819 RepID=UPI00110F98CE|nr:ABC transporter permease [Streptomyces sp. DASNCL29]TMU92686.1 ABC transporter permease [Streptomyces sp. DASNCL29]